MRVSLALLALLLPLGSGSAHAFCVQSDIPNAHAYVALVPPVPRPPHPVPKLFEETLQPRLEYCCNPRNPVCNPEKRPENMAVAMVAHFDLLAPDGRPGPRFACGAAANPREVRKVMVPLRGYLLFVENDGRPPPPGETPIRTRYLVRTFTDQKVFATAFPCVEAPR